MSCSVHLKSASASFTRPADTNNYATGDLVANSTTISLVEPMEFDIDVGKGRGIEIVGASVRKSGVAVTGATFILWLFSLPPTSTVADNTTFTSATVNVAGHFATVTFPAMVAYSDDAFALVRAGPQSGGINSPVTNLTSNSTIYGLLQAGGDYTDEASGEEFTVTLFYRQYPE